MYIVHIHCFDVDFYWARELKLLSRVMTVLSGWLTLYHPEHEQFISADVVISKHISRLFLSFLFKKNLFHSLTRGVVKSLLNWENFWYGQSQMLQVCSISLYLFHITCMIVHTLYMLMITEITESFDWKQCDKIYFKTTIKIFDRTFAYVYDCDCYCFVPLKWITHTIDFCIRKKNEKKTSTTINTIDECGCTTIYLCKEVALNAVDCPFVHDD